VLIGECKKLLPNKGQVLIGEYKKLLPNKGQEVKDCSQIVR
jgi:hypothetical protein